MSMVTEVTKKIILAGLGTIDEQNEEIKDLLKRGSAVMGINSVDNEELMYNGNREEILRKRKEREAEDNTISLGKGRSLYYNAVKDEEGNVKERNIEISRTPNYGTKELSVEAVKEDNGKNTLSIHSSEKDIENTITDNAKGGALDDKNRDEA